MNRSVVIVLAFTLAFTACREKEATSGSLDKANKVTMRPVRLYFESPQMLLISESKSVALSESQAAAVPALLRELMKGPREGGSSLRVWPEDTIVRGAYLLPGGTAVVDLGGPTLAGGWGVGSHHELMAIHSVVQTLAANFPNVKQVRLLVNGTPAETLAGHVALSRSHRPDPSMVDPASR